MSTKLTAQDEVDFDMVSVYLHPVDNGTYLTLVFGPELAECTATFINSTNDDDCSVNMPFDCDSEVCATGKCSVELDLPGTNHLRWYALKTPSGQSEVSQFYDWRDNNMVSTLDMSRIQAHILDITPFFSMAQYIQADVDGNGKVDDDDIDYIQDMILGQNLPPLPPWTFISAKWFALWEDFFYGMLMYEPSTEDFEEFRAEFEDAFNRKPAETVIIGQWKTQVSQSASFEDGFVGLKMGDVNYGSDPYDLCSSCVSGPGSGDDITARQSNASEKSAHGRVEIHDFGFFTEVRVFIQDVSRLHAIQFEIPFGNSMIDEVRLMDAALPHFSNTNYYLDRNANVLRCAWIDHKLNRNLRDTDLDDHATLTFGLYGVSGSQVEIASFESLFNVVGVYGSFQDIPLRFRIEKPRRIDAGSLIPRITTDRIEFVVDPGIDSEFILQLYSVSGQLINIQKAFSFRGNVTFELPIAIKEINGCIIYQLMSQTDLFSGKLIVLN